MTQTAWRRPMSLDDRRRPVLFEDALIRIDAAYSFAVMEATTMAHLSLQIGAAIPVPIGLPDSRWRRQAWRQRALREVAVQASPEERWPADQLSLCNARVPPRMGGTRAVSIMEAE